MADKLKLISSPFSPYGQRIEIALIEKEIDYDKEEIDLTKEKPDWFTKDSPLGKVPLLYTKNKVLFESIAILEYLEDAYTDISLHSEKLESRASHRAWIEFSNQILIATLQLISAQNEDDFGTKKLDLIGKLEILENNLKYSPYFDGDKFRMIDVCMAPVFKPLTIIDNKFSLEIFDLFPKISSYAESLIARFSLKKAVPENYEEILGAFVRRKKSFLLNL